jgi:enoyl-CoA hydratase/carnithine racemase
MPGIVVEQSADGIVVLSINRPDRRNALDSQTLAEMHAAFDVISGQTDVRVVVVTGSGTAFCSGADMKAVPQDFVEPSLTPAGVLAASVKGTIAQVFASQELMASLFEKIHRLRQPVIAAVNGPAVGGGFALTLACDIRFATPSASFGATFIRHGVSACDMGTSYHLPRLVGASRSAELLLTGRTFGAEEALQIGLVLKVVEEAQLLEHALRKAREISANGPLAVWMTKETMWQTIDAPSLRHAIDIENRTQVMCTATGELGNSFAAFRNNGSPQWSPL